VKYKLEMILRTCVLPDSCVWHLYRSTSKHVQFAPGNARSRTSSQSTFNTTCKIITTYCCQGTQSTVSAAFRNSIVYLEGQQQRSPVFVTLISRSQRFVRTILVYSTCLCSYTVTLVLWWTKVTTEQEKTLTFCFKS